MFRPDVELLAELDSTDIGEPLLSIGFDVFSVRSVCFNELHESVDGSRFRKLTPKRELASSTLGSVLDTSFDVLDAENRKSILIDYVSYNSCFYFTFQTLAAK